MHATTEYVFRALQAGARAYLLKESSGAEVVGAIHAVHRGNRSRMMRKLGIGDFPSLVKFAIQHGVVQLD